MNLLVLGSGGREHAIAVRLARDPGVRRVLVLPGNPGMQINPQLEILGGEVSLDRVVDTAKKNQIDLVVIGPEKFLFAGYVDALAKAGVSAFGPSKMASFLEESKIQSKQFMKRYQIPTSDFEVVHSESEAVLAIERHSGWQGFVIKLSGPALGKGVMVTENPQAAKQAISQFFLHRPPGIEEGVVIEEKVKGREVSLFYVCANEQFQFLASACDHKRLNDGDLGPNTGGMGAYSPCHWIDGEFLKQVEAKIVVPTLNGMVADGTPFRGMLFLGLMVDGPLVSLLEYNTRFGDPETQTFMPIVSGNVSELLLASAKGEMKRSPMSESLKKYESKKRFALHVVKAAKGYPGLFGEIIESGQAIQVVGKPSEWKDAHLFYAGVKRAGSEPSHRLVTSGGRVLGVTALGETPTEARARAYQHLDQIHFLGEQFRKDIGGLV